MIVRRSLSTIIFASLAMACAPSVPGGTDTDSNDSGGDDDDEDDDSSSGSETAATETSGDGDGTTSTSTSGDGDGTTSGDGDGTTSTSTSGDGDGTTTGDGDGCPVGSEGCPCFANNTCFEPHQCIGGTCGCMAGTIGCSCGAGDSCDAGLSCDAGTCSPGGNPDILGCGQGTSCNAAGGEACCWDTYMSEGAPQGECVTGTVGADGCQTQQDGAGHETRIECQGSAQCSAGEICCGELYDSPMGQNYMQVTCETGCGSFQVCTVDQECPGGEQCNSSNYLPTGYGYCA